MKYGKQKEKKILIPRFQMLDFRLQKGVAIYLAIIIMSVLLTISLGIATITINQIKISRGIEDSVVAFYAADSGIERILYDANCKSGCLGLSDGWTISSSEGEFSNGASYLTNITYVIDENLIKFKSTGEYKGVKRAIETSVPLPLVESPVWQLCAAAVAPTLTCKAAMLKAYMGYKFVPGVKGQVTKLCGYFGGSTLTVKLYDGGYQEKAQASISSNQAWVCQSITPVDVSKGSTYYVLAAFPVGTNRYCMRKRADSAPFLPENCGTTIDIKSAAFYFTVVTPLPPLDPAQLYYADNEMWGMVDIIFAY